LDPGAGRKNIFHEPFLQSAPPAGLLGLPTPRTDHSSSRGKQGWSLLQLCHGPALRGNGGVARNKAEYISKAIQHYQEALKADPGSSIIFEELTDLYIQTNRLRDAVTQAEEMLKQSPDNLDARRMLGRIYTRMAGENQSGRVDERYLKQAIEQFQKVTEKDPKDVESLVMLGKLHSFSKNSIEAEKALNAALAVDPANEDALTQLALLYANLGDSKRAIEKLKAVTEKAPNDRVLKILADQYYPGPRFQSAPKS
jgi:tetratricopeptide (TPR) repeat protein